MLSFREPRMEDKRWMEPIFRASGFRGCEYDMTNLLAWADTYQERIAEIDGFLVVQVGTGGTFGWSAGTGDRKALIKTLYDDAAARAVSFSLLGLTAEQVEELDAMYPGKFAYTSDRDSADYCYLTEKLATLGGKKLHAKRNHINRFLENYPDWSVEEIGPDNIAACVTLDRDWAHQDYVEEKKDAMTIAGERALAYAFDHYVELELEGIALRANGRIVAFCMGQRISHDTFDVIFEKGYADIQGAYAMINRSFARWMLEKHPEITYLNREEDLGEPGLRKAKLSYYPDLLLEKYSAALKEGETL